MCNTCGCKGAETFEAIEKYDRDTDEFIGDRDWERFDTSSFQDAQRDLVGFIHDSKRDEQTKKIQTAFKESREEMKSAFDDLQPRLRASTEKLKDKLRGDLTEEQIEKFSKYLRPGPTNPRDRFKAGPGKRPSGARGENRPRRGERLRDKRNSEQKQDSVIDNSIN